MLGPNVLPPLGGPMNQQPQTAPRTAPSLMGAPPGGTAPIIPATSGSSTPTQFTPATQPEKPRPLMSIETQPPQVRQHEMLSLYILTDQSHTVGLRLQCILILKTTNSRILFFFFQNSAYRAFIELGLLKQTLFYVTFHNSFIAAFVVRVPKTQVNSWFFVMKIFTFLQS